MSRPKLPKKVIILLHTSKTMRPPAEASGVLQNPELRSKAKILDKYLKTLSVKQIASAMSISSKLASTTHELIAGWTDNPSYQRVAIDSFIGDIYSGLQVLNWTSRDRQYADETLRILSGLYGVLRPLDGICPYRLEMGYRLPSKKFKNLYNFWGDSIAKTLPSEGIIVNLAAIEYSKTVTNFVDNGRVVTPSFLTVSPKTGEPTFVVVHAKIARGAFASWLIKQRISSADELQNFQDLNYKFDRKLSTPKAPVFVCKTFGGIGLSVRLT